MCLFCKQLETKFLFSQPSLLTPRRRLGAGCADASATTLAPGGLIRSERSGSCCPPPQLQHSEAFRGQWFKNTFLIQKNPICQTLQSPIWEEASHLEALLIYSPAGSPRNKLWVPLATKTHPSLLGGGFQNNLVALKGAATASSGLEWGIRTPSCCPPHGLYSALCFGTITLFTAMTKAAHLVSKCPLDC